MTGTMMVTSLIAVVVAIAAATAIALRTSGPDAAQFAALKDPRLTTLPSQRMLVVESVGDPNVVGSRAFKTLFRTYFRMSGVPKARSQPAPRARWPQPLDTPRNQWVGRYALPLPPTAPALAATRTDDGLRVGTETWTYGEVAEVLHVGTYASEEPDIRRLLDFISSHGYRAIGEHEEEYVKGPGMFFAGNADEYLTIIRLRVEPVGVPAGIRVPSPPAARNMT